MRKVLLSLTTTPGSCWKEKLKKTTLKEVAVFPTFLEERREFYNLLENSSIENIPLVHLRGDMKPEEIDYFVKKYQTKVFNIHSENQHPIFYDFSKYKNIIYIENHGCFKEGELDNFAGVCLDFTHLENDFLLKKEENQETKKILEKYKIGCNHISAIKKKPKYTSHYLNKLSELDYLKKYPLKYFSSFIAIELENSFKEQMKVKKYIEKEILSQ